MTSSVALAQTAPMFADKQPIEINADTLEVQQENSLAIFTSSVVAVQGKTRLKADKMTVYYRKKDGQAADAPAETGAVDKIIVEGNVLITNPTDTASGNSGIYDVGRQRVTLNGNVTLTRGQNVLKGESLVYDMETGKSVINSAGGDQPGQPKGGRVRALIVPEKK